MGVVDMKSFLFMFVVYSTPTLGVLGTNIYIHIYWQWHVCSKKTIYRTTYITRTVIIYQDLTPTLNFDDLTAW